MSHDDEPVNPTIKVQPTSKGPADAAAEKPVASVEEHVQQIARSVGEFLARGCVDAWNAIRPEKGASSR